MKKRSRTDSLLLIQDPAPTKHEIAVRRGVWRHAQQAIPVRHVPSATYFARIRVRGKLLRKSLKTDVLSVAKLRLADLEKAERQIGEMRRRRAKGG